MEKESLNEIAERLLAARNVAIFMHQRPDGDAVGSGLALAYALESKGIACELCVDGGAPEKLRFIDGTEKIQKAPTRVFDLAVAVDCSDEQRFGFLYNAWIGAKRKNVDTVNIDHHASNTRFARYNYVRRCAANCMNISALIEYMGVPFDKKLSEYLLVGLMTDSGNFAHDDVTEETMLLAARLLRYGADMRRYHYLLFERQSKARAALLARTAANIRYFHDDRFAVVVVSRKALQECGADNAETEGFVAFPLSVETVEVAASLLEVKKGQYKVSLRSKEYADVNRIAGVYGGGGHVRAAGCMLFGEIEDILDRLSYTVSQYLE